jgi:hypothetical protein
MSRTLSRRQLLIELSAVAVGQSVLFRNAGAQTGTPIEVYKDPSCGCCRGWVKHMEANGFTAKVTDTSDMAAIKKQHHVDAKLQSCHTALVAGYVVEGHVPATDVRRLLKEKPKVLGLTIPGMPQSAPGMDGKPFQPYEVLTFDATGKTGVFAKHSTE